MARNKCDTSIINATTNQVHDVLPILFGGWGGKEGRRGRGALLKKEDIEAYYRSVYNGHVN